LTNEPGNTGELSDLESSGESAVYAEENVLPRMRSRQLGYGCLLVIWGLTGCARSGALPPPASMSPPVLPAVPPPAMMAPDPGSLQSIQTPARNNWRPGTKERDWKYIVLHHTAADAGSVESIHETHLQRKDANGNPWLGIGYHFVIGNGQGMTDGDIEPTFRWKQQLQGAHAGSSDPAYNQQGIGIVLIGNFEKTPPTAKQLTALKELVRTLKTNYRISAQNIIGHRDVRATECPGKLFPMDDVAHVPVDVLWGAAPAPTPTVVR